MDNEAGKITKGTLLDYIDAELAEIEETTAFPNRGSEYFSRMEVMTFSRNAFNNMPINDYQAGIIFERAGVQILDDIYTHWRDFFMEWGDSQEKKLDSSYNLLEDYIKSLERDDFTHKLYEKAMAEIVTYNNELISTPADVILSNARRFVAFNAMLPLLEPNNGFENEEVLALLTLDQPLSTIYNTWLQTKGAELCEEDLLNSTQKTICEQIEAISLGLHGTKTQNLESKNWLSIYTDKYADRVAANELFQEQVPDGGGIEP